MMKAILTGYEPFGDYKFNPTKDLVLRYDGAKIGDIEVTGIVLPCTYYAFFSLENMIADIKPDIILETGFASRVPCLQIETLGKNKMGSKYADAYGFNPDNLPIIAGGQEKYPTNADNQWLSDALRSNSLDCGISSDADTFICNSLIYFTSRKISQQSLRIKFAFMHIPWTDSYADKVNIEPGKRIIREKDLNKSVEIILTELGKQAFLKRIPL